MHDVSPVEGEGPNFELLDAIEYWEVPIEGGPPPDNPVPAGDGSLYSAPAAPPAAAQPDAAPTEAPEDLFTENGGDFRGPAENGHSGPVRSRHSRYPTHAAWFLACALMLPNQCLIGHLLDARAWVVRTAFL